MDAATISAIAEVIDALPDGPYVVVETPFPALEQIAGRDINLGSCLLYTSPSPRD